MIKSIKFMVGGAAFAALAAATPATAQYYGQNYGQNYGQGYGYGYNNTAQIAAQQCSAAVQQRLSYRGRTGIIGSLFGVNTNTAGRVMSVTQVTPRRNSVRVRGLATSGRMAYSPYGSGYYGMLGSNYAYQPDLSFSCTVDYRGYVRDVDINRR